MSKPLQDRVESALADLEKQRASMHALQKAMESTVGTAHSKNRMITATVDRAGRLTELKFEGERYRTIAPAELASLVVQTVRDAQQDAAEQTARAAAAAMPRSAMFLGGRPAPGAPLDVDGLFDAAMQMLDRPILDPAGRPQAERGAR